MALGAEGAAAETVGRRAHASNLRTEYSVPSVRLEKARLPPRYRHDAASLGQRCLHSHTVLPPSAGEMRCSRSTKSAKLG
jgi:hypothetical protein